ncbi:hypothetical protein HDV05_007432 [Chytridiales sp. JEL 0842]|nr:hypothetical protein HDV05_007432 [Chytridiales sp. JEL 0842]
MASEQPPTYPTDPNAAAAAPTQSDSAYSYPPETAAGSVAAPAPQMVPMQEQAAAPQQFVAVSVPADPQQQQQQQQQQPMMMAPPQQAPAPTGDGFVANTAFNKQEGLPWTWTQPWVAVCCCFFDLKFGALTLAALNFISDIILMGLTFNGFTIANSWRSYLGGYIYFWYGPTPAAYIISGLVFLVLTLLDCFGFYAIIKCIPAWIRLYALGTWARLLAVFIFYIVSFYTDPASVAILIIYSFIQIYLQICTWSFYLDTVNNPQKYAPEVPISVKPLMGVTTQQPAMQQQPAPMMQQPSMVMQQQQPVMQQQPSMVMQQQPTPIVQQQPSMVMAQAPAPMIMQEQPSMAAMPVQPPAEQAPMMVEAPAQPVMVEQVSAVAVDQQAPVEPVMVQQVSAVAMEQAPAQPVMVVPEQPSAVSLEQPAMVQQPSAVSMGEQQQPAADAQEASAVSMGEPQQPPVMVDQEASAISMGEQQPPANDEQPPAFTALGYTPPPEKSGSSHSLSKQ